MSFSLSLALLLSAPFVAPGLEGEPDLELQCDIGPVAREYGGSAFEVYSCDDGKSVVAVAEEKSPAYPFYFIVTPAGEGVRLYGEGSGDNAASRAAFTDLNRTKAVDLAALVEATRARGPG